MSNQPDTSERTFPMPNDRIGDATVIASKHYSDIRGVEEWSVLLLHPEPYFFQCVIVRADTDELLDEGERHANIVTAVAQFDDEY